MITNKEKGQFTPARRLNNEIPERLDLIIDKMIAKDPRHRYATCAEVISDLENLNLAAESLSFITADDKVVRRRGGPGSRATTDTPTAPGLTAQRQRPGSQPTKAMEIAPARKKAGQSRSKDHWYVRHTDSTGKIKVSRMSTEQVLQAMRSNKLDLRTRATRDPNQGDFLPLAQYPVFEDEANRLVTRIRSQRRDDGLAAAYKKIEKQYDRQKWWRLLSRFRDGTLGFVGLILWLVAVTTAVAALGFAVVYGYEFLGQYLDARK